MPDQLSMIPGDCDALSLFEAPASTPAPAPARPTPERCPACHGRTDDVSPRCTCAIQPEGPAAAAELELREADPRLTLDDPDDDPEHYCDACGEPAWPDDPPHICPADDDAEAAADAAELAETIAHAEAPEHFGTHQLHDLAAALALYADDARLTLVARTLRDACRQYRATIQSAAHVDQEPARRALLHALAYGARELRGGYDHAHDERPTLDALDVGHRAADAATLDALDPDDEAQAVTAAWMGDPARWLLGSVFAQYAERIAADDGICEWLAHGTHGGGGPGYVYQCDGGGITVATSYADTQRSAAAVGPVRRVTWVALRRAAGSTGQLF